MNEGTALALAGFHGAFGRFEAALQVQSAEGLYITATEATFWLVAIDDWYERQGGPYAQKRDANPAGKTLRGLRWARNQGVHNLVAAHTQTGGMTFPMTFPLEFKMRLVWESPAKLPTLKQEQPKNEKSYLELVGREVRGTLLEALAFQGKVM